MSWGRALSTSVATLSVVGCAALVIGMHSSGSPGDSAHPPTVSATQRPAPVAERIAVPAPTALATTGDGPSAPRSPVRVPSTSPARPQPAGSTSVAPARASTRPVAAVPRPVSTPHSAPRAAPATHATPPATRVAPPAAASPTGTRLPLGYSTGSATRVLTVTASSASSTVATLQPWTKVSGGWRKVGSSVTAHIGADGMSTHASESRSATPMGSFTLTQAFGRDANPGTGLPYFTTTPADYWVSDEGSTYNTHQRCPSSNSGCLDDGVNERLYYETPYYNYAVVIDYNTRNAPGGVHAGRGSAFFLHVYPPGTGPTAGCVSIPQSRLVPIMRWLTPSAHPRILIGTV